VRAFLIAILLCQGLVGTAQSRPVELNRVKNVVFYGLDFTFLKLVNQEGFVDKNGKPMCNTLTFKYFNEWNEMFLIERKKFNLSRYFELANYTIDQATVTERNKAYVTDECITSNNDYRPAVADLTDAVKAYGAHDATGVGCVIFVESFNKVNKVGIVTTVFFDLSDHSVIKVDRQEGSPVGDGFRNYWINSIDNALSKGSKAYRK